MNLDLGINIPQDAAASGDGETIRAFVTAAEREGYGSLWVSESTKPDVLDPLAVLNFAAAASTHPRLGVAVLLPAFRAPLQLARDIATLDRVSGGRSVIGVGLGNERDLYARYGLSPAGRPARFEAGTRLLRRLLAEDRVTSNDRWWQLADVPRPLGSVQSPTPPILYGARQPAALERAVRLGDGWIGAGSMSLPAFSTALGHIRGCLESTDRSVSDFTIAKRVYIQVGHDDATTRTALRGWFAHHYGRGQLADEVAVVGDAEHCAAHLETLRSLGTTTLILHPVLDTAEQMPILANDVATRLH